MTTLKVLKKEDGFWLSIEGKYRALIRLESKSQIVNLAIEEASKISAPMCDALGCRNNQVYFLCKEHLPKR